MMWNIKKFVCNYLIFTGVMAHLLAMALLFQYPSLRQAVINKVALLASVVSINEEEPVFDEDVDVASVFGVWTAQDTHGLAAKQVLLSGVPYPDLATALLDLKHGDTLELGPGVYKTPLILRKNDLTIVGRGHVVFDGIAAEGKAAIIIKGNNTLLANIECQGIRVPDKNGSCVRLEGKNLTLDHVYFHHSEQGVLTSGRPGSVKILDSRFEALGKAGRSHGIYIGGGELDIENSLFIASVDQGHEIKSRASVTSISRSVIASLDSNDSRLIDISNGGVLIISDSVLQQGPHSVNADLIGFGLERARYQNNQVNINNTLVIMERRGPNQLLHTKDQSISPTVTSNVFISKKEPNYGGINLWYESRKQAGIKDYPYVPLITK